MNDVEVADPRASLTGARDELRAAFDEVLAGGRYILGERVSTFEREWAARCATKHAVGVSSGTDALALALRALGVGERDEVLVPAMTALATWMAVAQIGAVPVGVDIDEGHRGMDPAKAKAAITPRTRAIVIVHLFGQPAAVGDLQTVASEAGLPLVEDAAQAHGATVGGRPVGSLGTVAAFSFYPTKNLGAIGDAGAVTTSDDGLAERVRMLREYGWRTRADAEMRGVNARLDELQAAFLLVMLMRLETANARRAHVARIYSERLTGMERLRLPPIVEGTSSAWHLYVVNHSQRDELAARLSRRGVRTAVHYDPPPHVTTAFAGEPGAFSVAERHARTALSLPMHPGLSDADVDRVTIALREAC